MKPSIRIFVPYHKKSFLYKSELLTPIHVGRSLLSKNKSNKDIEWLLANTIGDDSGENISYLNPNLNELTAIYWVWKNYQKIGNPDYVGFQHYRRFLCFNEELSNSPGSWTINYKKSPKNYLEEIGFTEENIRQFLSQSDGIVSYVRTPGLSVEKQYHLAEKSDYHIRSDLEILEKIIFEKRPDFREATIDYLKGDVQHFGNIFILKREIFKDYCDFIFPILMTFLERVNFTDRADYQKRMFVSERLTGIFFEKLKKDGRKIHNSLVALLEHSDVPCKPIPAFSENSVNCLFAVDGCYLPKLAVTLTSLLKNCNKNNNYDLLILHKDLDKKNIIKFLKNFEDRTNVKIRFINITPYLISIPSKEFYIEIHVSIATYYRFFIQEIFSNYKKILYLDSDLIVLDDISKLFDSDLGDKYIGVARDVREDLAFKLDIKVSNNVRWRSYIVKTLRLKDAKNYFQAGVILFDLERLKMEKFDLLEQCITELRRIKTPILSDQDVLNSVFNGSTHFFGVRWNIEWQILFEFPDFQKIMSSEDLLEFKKALTSPAIIHYASSVKPWKVPSIDLAEDWWSYARSTLYYEEFIQELVLFSNSRISTDSMMMKLANKLLPKGTKRREFIKRIYRAFYPIE